MVTHLHGDLLALTRRITDVLGSDRVLDSHEQTEKGRIDILVDGLSAVDEFAAHWDAKVDSSRGFLGRTDATATKTIGGIRVTVSGNDYVTAVAS